MAEPQSILVDGTNYLFRAFHALPPLMNKDGRPTGAIYGMHNMLRKLQKNYSSSNIIVVFDAPGPTFRDELFVDYKATRAPMPEDLRDQINWVKKLVKAMGLPTLEISGVEADDVIGTLASAGVDRHAVLICTSDKDMAQLVCDQVLLLDERKNQILDKQAVFSKFAVWPEQIIDYLALAGDTSDNIPGVSKVGPKTAAKWLETYQSIEGIVQHQDEIGGAIGENLRAAVKEGVLALSKKLATIDCNVKLDTQLDDLRPTKPNLDELSEIYEYMGSKRLLAELSLEVPVERTDGNDAPSYDLLSVAEVRQWVEKLHKAGTFACYALDDGGRPGSTGMVGIAFSCQPDCAGYVQFNHAGLLPVQQIDKTNFVSCLSELFEDPSHTILSPNGKQILHLLQGLGIKCQAKLEDVALLAYVLEGAQASKDLDSLAQQNFALDLMSEQELLGKGRKKITYAESNPLSAATYAGGRADAALRLYQKMAPSLAHNKQLTKIYYDFELPLVRVLATMEQCGTRVDPDILHRQSKTLTAKLSTLQQEIWALAGHEFNINSTQQLQKVLFEEQGLPPKKKTKTGIPSTNESVLAELALNYELPRLLMIYRSLTKLKTTYLDKLPEDINLATGRIHTSFHQMATSTGRLSSINPNLQNIPIRTDEGRKIRQAFIPADKKLLLSADYSQIELRVMAHISADEGLLAAFRNHQDVHRTTAASILSIPLDEVSDNQRREAKTVNFGLIYGMGAFSLSKQLGITQPAAQDYINDYFDRYPGVRQYMDNVLIKAKELGYVETHFGRRLFVPSLSSARGAQLKAIERATINAPIQGTAADIIKLAMVRIDAWLKNEAELSSAAMILQVHDELVFEVAPEQLPRLEAGLREHMSVAASLKVPLEVNIGHGANWMEAH